VIRTIVTSWNVTRSIQICTIKPNTEWHGTLPVYPIHYRFTSVPLSGPLHNDLYTPHCIISINIPPISCISSHIMVVLIRIEDNSSWWYLKWMPDNSSWYFITMAPWVSISYPWYFNFEFFICVVFSLSCSLFQMTTCILMQICEYPLSISNKRNIKKFQKI